MNQTSEVELEELVPARLSTSEGSGPNVPGPAVANTSGSIGSLLQQNNREQSLVPSGLFGG